ncbi:HAD hydrolase family protein, partial [Streptococcus agalactiae]|nr:HAD hydrolase family protein [Streptococcus agalactiae]
MNFVFDIDGTLCFDGMSLSKEIQGILERAQIDYGHRVTFATARSYRDTIGILGDKLSLSKIIGLNGATLHENGHLVDSYYLQSDF